MRRTVKSIGTFLTVIAVTVVAFRAFEKGSLGEPEWCFWAEAAGAGSAWERTDLGYLPAFSVLLRPFFVVEPTFGLAAFIALALACSWAGFHLAWKMSAAEDPAMQPGYTAWHLLWFSGPFLVSLRNNQVSVQMLLLVILGLALMARGRGVLGAVAVGCSVWFKPLPLTLGLYLVLKRRFAAAVTLGAVTLGGSLFLTAVDVGFLESVERHRTWPRRVLALEPAPVADSAGTGSLGLNQSIAATIVRREPQLGRLATVVLRWSVFWLSLLAVVALVTRRREGPRWDELALWLAWTAFAAPFGRYYYAVLLVPAWLVLLREDRRDLRWWTAAFLPLLAWGGPTMGVYAVSTTLTFLLLLERLAKRTASVRAQAAIPEAIESRADLALTGH